MQIRVKLLYSRRKKNKFAFAILPVLFSELELYNDNGFAKLVVFIKGIKWLKADK